MSDVEDVVRAFAARLCSDFEQELGQDAPHFKRRVIHELKLALPPHAGRPRLAARGKTPRFRPREASAWPAARRLNLAPSPGIS